MERLSPVAPAQILEGHGVVNHLRLPFRDRLELVSHLLELLHRQHFLRILARFARSLLGLFEVGQCIFLVLAGLFTLVLIKVLLGVAHLGNGRRIPGAGSRLGVQFCQAFELARSFRPGSLAALWPAV